MAMSEECRAPSCTTPPGEQARDDYNARLFCSIECETKFDHLKADAADARRDAEAEAAEVLRR